MKNRIRRLLRLDENVENRQAWLSQVLADINPGSRILDAGAGELRNRRLCAHLEYVSQDVCEYTGSGEVGLHNKKWDTSNIDIVCDITSIPVADDYFDTVLCSEVLEHVADPLGALQELNRVLRPGGYIILTAPFVSLVHQAPHYYSSGFSEYWYRAHLERLGFEIVTLSPNGDWRSLLRQEILRGLKSLISAKGWQSILAILFGLPSLLLVGCLPGGMPESRLACLGWHCLARKKGG